MAKKGTVILEHEQIALITKRFAHRLHEDHHAEKEIFLVGILDNGFVLAKRIAKHLEEVSKLKVHLMSISLDKARAYSESAELSNDPKLMSDKVVILIDDVLNSGRTLVHALGKILSYDARLVKTIVLVDRIHRSFPVKADHVGMSLSTTLQERVEVNFATKENYAYLIWLKYRSLIVSSISALILSALTTWWACS